MGHGAAIFCVPRDLSADGEGAAAHTVAELFVLLQVTHRGDCESKAHHLHDARGHGAPACEVVRARAQVDVEGVDSRSAKLEAVAASCRWHDRVPRPRGLRGIRPTQWSRSCQSYPQARWTNPKMDTDTHTLECMHHTPRIPIVVGPATQAHPTRPPAATRHTRSSKHNGKPVQSTLH